MRLRLQFEKNGPSRFTSHKDIVRIFQRCFASCGIPMSYSEGFHPHMKMSFGPPLRTGWESDAEFMDIFVERPPGPLAELCNGSLPEGLRVCHVSMLPDYAPKLAADICAAEYEVQISTEDVYGPGGPGSASNGAEKLRDGIERCTGTASAGDESPKVLDVTVSDHGDRLGFRYKSTMLSGKVVSPIDLIEGAVGDPQNFREIPRIRRTAQYVRRGNDYISPVDKGAFQRS